MNKERYHRLAHFKYQTTLVRGEPVRFGKTVLSRVGTTGKSTGPHVHADGTLAKPISWYQYRSRPLQEYFDTEPWAAVVMPYPGRHLTNRHGRAGHVGVDINVAPDDEGLPIFSPVNGEVVFVEPAISVYRLTNGIRTLFQPTQGGGFGNFIWLREQVSPTEGKVLEETKKHLNIRPLILAELPIVVNALDFLGYSMQDVLNSYTNLRRTKKPIFDLRAPRPRP